MSEKITIGAFTIAPIKKDDEVNAYEIKSASGNFLLRVDVTTPLAVVLGLDYEDVKNIIEGWLSIIYLTTQSVPDFEYLKSFIDNYDKLVKRWEASKELASEVVNFVDEQEQSEKDLQKVAAERVGKDELDNVLDETTKSIKAFREEYKKYL